MIDRFFFGFVPGDCRENGTGDQGDVAKMERLRSNGANKSRIDDKTTTEVGLSSSRQPPNSPLDRSTTTTTTAKTTAATTTKAAQIGEDGKSGGCRENGSMDPYKELEIYLARVIVSILEKSNFSSHHFDSSGSQVFWISEENYSSLHHYSYSRSFFFFFFLIPRLAILVTNVSRYLRLVPIGGSVGSYDQW